MAEEQGRKARSAEERETQIVEAALALRRLEEARGEVARLREAVLFARSTAHDLAQPLTTILARTQLLLRNLQPDDPSRRAVGIVEK